jgi:hypothetical protein
MRLLVLVMSILVCCQAATLTAENQTATVRVHVNAVDKPIEGAEVVVAGTTHRRCAHRLDKARVSHAASCGHRPVRPRKPQGAVNQTLSGRPQVLYA